MTTHHATSNRTHSHQPLYCGLPRQKNVPTHAGPFGKRLIHHILIFVPQKIPVVRYALCGSRYQPPQRQRHRS